jgi:hypothetical protein
MSSMFRRRLLRQDRTLWLLDRLEREPRADAVIDELRTAIRSLPLLRGRDVLHGRWLGHPVHPPMAQVPIGGWLSAVVPDLRPGRSRGAGLLVGAGLAASVAPRPAFDTRILDGHVEVCLGRQDRGEHAGNGGKTNRQTSGTGEGTAHGHSS